MKQGDWFQVDLGKMIQLRSIALDTRESPKDFPKTFRIMLSLDGNRWAKSPNALRGGPASQVRFGPGQRARFIRFEVEGVDGDQPWSIHEVRVVTGGGVRESRRGDKPWANKVAESN